MTLLQSLVLGLVQGVTEFLPISSDGHLALAYRLLDTRPNLSFEVFLHGATLIAMYAYFGRDIVRLASALLPKNAARKDDRRLVLWIIVATAISAIIALVLGPFLEDLAENMIVVALGFYATTILLAIAEALTHGASRFAESSELKGQHAGVIGVFQGLAALPGVSRSGSTIAGGMMFGLSREEAARFSFLLGIPIITLAAVKDGLDVVQGASHLPGTPLVLALGFLAAGVSGFAAIWGLLRFVKDHRLYWFAAYTGLLGTVILLLSVFG